MGIGEKIRELRKARGWSQDVLGEKLGVQKSAISKYERGFISRFSQDQIEQIAKVFDVSPAVLMGYSEEVEEMNALIRRVEGLSPERVKQVMAFLDALDS